MRKTVRVLLACPRSGNPYISELVRHLNASTTVSCVQSSDEFLDSHCLEYDIVHFQWPEAIFGWNTKVTADEVLLLKRRLAFCHRSGIKTVLTVHNDSPHILGGSCYSELYRCIYDHVDGFVHLGRASLQIPSEKNGSSLSAKNFVIPHGNYQFFREVDTEDDPLFPITERFSVLCFGAVRKPSEVKVICEVADLVAKFDGRLILAGRIFSGSRRRVFYYKMRVPLFVRKNIHVVEGKIPDGSVASLVSSCDAVLIPRVDTINSGNLALGLTFGKVVLGPKIGNIGEELEKLGNPTFEPTDLSSLKRAVLELRRAVDSNLGQRNRVYADTELAWENVAKLHENMYRNIQES